MIVSKFGIGQQVCYFLLGYFGVVVDIDLVYLFFELLFDELVVNDEFCVVLWYYVVMEDDNGLLVYIYLVEVQLSSELQDEYFVICYLVGFQLGRYELVGCYCFLLLCDIMEWCEVCYLLLVYQVMVQRVNKLG